MYCRTCNYTLFNLPEPRCPECGTEFDVRQYRFRPNMVAFACPACGHLHGGTGERHLPAETEQAMCLGCGQPMQVGAMRVVPLVSDLSQAAATSAITMPWEERQGVGWWQAALRTIKLVMLKPTEAGQTLREPGRFGDPYWFATGILLAAAAVGALFAMVFTGGMFLLMQTLSRGAVGMGLSQFALQLTSQLTGLPFSFIQTLLGVALWAGSIHLYLRYAAGLHRPFIITVRCFLYSYAPLALNVIPIVSCFSTAWWVWSVISLVILVQQAHGVTGKQAAIACLLWPAVCIVLGLLVGAAVVAWFLIPHV